MAQEFKAATGDQFRIMCPDCGVTWFTLTVPAECPDCGATVTFRVISRPKPENAQSR